MFLMPGTGTSIERVASISISSAVWIRFDWILMKPIVFSLAFAHLQLRLCLCLHAGLVRLPHAALVDCRLYTAVSALSVVAVVVLRCRCCDLGVVFCTLCFLVYG